MRNPFILSAIPFVLVTGTSIAATVPAPKAPSNLIVKPVGVNSFKLAWKDNSNNETGWEILVALKGGKPARFILLPSPNATSYTLSTINNELPNKDLVFQIRAYNGVAGKEQFSKASSIVTATALPSSTFGTPTKLTAKTIDDGQILVSWKDNATSENGYAMEYKKSKDKNWSSLGTAQPDTKFSVPSFGYEPLTRYSFRVRAFKGNPGVATAYSNIAEATTLKFQAPTKFAASAAEDGAFIFKWSDNSSIEQGYELEKRIGKKGAFSVQGTVPANTNKTTPVTGFSIKADYQFRLRGFRTVDSKKVYTGYSKTIDIRSSALSKPTKVVAAPVDDYSVKLDWQDNSLRESGYLIRYRKVGSSIFTNGDVVKTAANAKTATVGNLIPGTLYEFQVSNFLNDFFGNTTGVSAAVSLQSRTKDGIAGDLNPPIFYGTSFTYTVKASRLAELTSLNVTNVPSGLTYDAATRTISGTLSEDGVKTITMAASFKSAPSVTRSLVLRVVRPPAAPVIVAPFSQVNLAPAGSQVVSVNNKFADADTPSAARVATTKGTFDIILFSQATPATVANFLNYVDAGRYTDSFFHRSVKDFVVQGGGFKYTSATGFAAVTKNTAIANEPGVSNVEGTVAMAKVDKQPDSATSQFFVNVDDGNPAILDNQNGGFTAFGRVPDEGMVVVDAIAALPTKNYSLSGLGAVGDIPMNAATAPKEMEVDKLVKITGVTAAPILSYTVTSDNPAIATATLSGTNVTITGIAAGSTTVEVKAKDLDNNEITQDIPVQVTAP